MSKGNGAGILIAIIGAAATIGAAVIATIPSKKKDKGKKIVIPLQAQAIEPGQWTTHGLAYGALLSQDEAQAVVNVGNRLGINPSHISTVAFSESGWNPHIHLNKNGMKGETPIYTALDSLSSIGPKTIGGGLIGFMRSTMKTYPISLEQLLRLDRIGQLPYVEEFYRRWINAGVLKPGASVRSLKMATLYPAATKYADMPDQVLWSSVDPKTKRAYFSNKSADRNKDGVTTIGEAMAKIDGQLAKGLSKKHVRP